MIEGTQLTKIAGQLAAEEGMDHVAAVPLRLLSDERFQEWVSRGFDGEMAYLSRWKKQRMRPAEHFEPYRSVLLFAAPYGPGPPPDSSSDVGNISRYALGDDYHRVLKEKAQRILERLSEEDPDLRGRVLVDTAPILEKVAAARAGLGWQGKHTNIIREDAGSWFFLVELLVDRDVPEPGAAVDRCGICRDCIDVCPTGAIVAPYVLDSRLCISYLTIELRGPIPRELRESVGNRIFGCDDCQEVCPWNRFATQSPIAEFRSRPGLRERSLVDWMEMSRETWTETFRGSAVKRAKYDGFKRNVAVALGNAASPGAIPVLGRALGLESALVRLHVVWALGRIGGEEARQIVLGHRESESDRAVLDEMEVVLGG